MPHPRNSDPVKSCATCQNPITRRMFGARLEDFGVFRRRAFCSLRCANSRSRNGLSRKAHHYRARKFRKMECEACGSRYKLHVHHVDQDWSNEDPLNFQTLCTACHRFWHGRHDRLGLQTTQRMPDMRTLISLGRKGPARGLEK